ncbi:MAG: glutathione S-transferase family protein [Alphaproteobacteria bacterium]|nr:glutathione S-transferase family protein [Alphaproteobacteria bacterium]
MTAIPVLVGQYDSPFVRRVAVTLHHYGMTFERRVLSTFADFDAMQALSPLGKVPVLVLEDGEPLWDSRAILDVLHRRAEPARRLLPDDEAPRRRVLRIEAAAVGLAEKSVDRAYEVARRAPGTQDPAHMARVERQIAATLAWLAAADPAPYFLGETFSIADVTAAVALTYLREKLPQLCAIGAHPALDRHHAMCEALPAFRAAAYSAAEAARSGWRPET